MARRSSSERAAEIPVRDRSAGAEGSLDDRDSVSEEVQPEETGPYFALLLVQPETAGEDRELAEAI